MNNMRNMKNMNNNDKYYRYQMTFPFESNKVHKSKNLDKVVRKCYGEYRSFSDINDGMFCITNLDKNIEYRFKIKNKKIKKLKSYQQDGGEIATNMNLSYQKTVQDQVDEISKLEGDPEPTDEPRENVTQNQFNEIATKLDNTNEGINNMTNEISITNQNITDMTSKIVETSESEQQLLNEILKIKTPIQQPLPIEVKENIIEPETGKDLFDDIDVFDRNLRRLYTIKKIHHMEGKTENTCVIF